MKKCRVCAATTDDYPVVGGYFLRMCRPCYNAQRRASHDKNRVDRNAKAMQRYHSNMNGAKDKRRAFTVARYQVIGAPVRAWFENLPDAKKLEIGRAKQARYRCELTDCYVRRLITTTTVQVPQALIQAKRLQIKIERFCNE